MILVAFERLASQNMVLTVGAFGELTNAEPFDEENTGWGWKVVEAIETAQTIMPTTCNMTRPTDRAPPQAK